MGGKVARAKTEILKTEIFMSENQNQNLSGISLQPSPGAFAPPSPTPAGEGDLPKPNPFRSRTWNLTAQMRLLRDDPKKARRLKAEAEADGEVAGPKVGRPKFY